MKAIFLFIPLFFLAGCATSVCPENLNLSQDYLLAYENHPNTRGLTKVFDHTISIEGEVHELKVYDIRNGSYYVQFNPVRSFSSDWYGPYTGVPLVDLQCH